ncbi:MAG: cyclase/dehydrase [bacterium]|nr:cyclase/dehydrase [bacterium]
MVFRSLAGCALLACAFATPAAARPTLDSGRLDELGRYQVLTFADPFKNGIERGKAIGVIDATPEEVFRVATDYAKYRDFMPRVTASTVKEATRDHVLVEMRAELRWPAGASKVTARYTHEKLPGDIYRVRFDMVDGSLKQYLGSLYIEPFMAGKTAVTYELVAEPDSVAPKSAINRGIKRSTGNFVNALRQRVNDLHRLGYLHPEPLAPQKSDARSPLVGAPPAADPSGFKARR